MEWLGRYSISKIFFKKISVPVRTQIFLLLLYCTFNFQLTRWKIDIHNVKKSHLTTFSWLFICVQHVGILWYIFYSRLYIKSNILFIKSPFSSWNQAKVQNRSVLNMNTEYDLQCFEEWLVWKIPTEDYTSPICLLVLKSDTITANNRPQVLPVGIKSSITVAF